MSDVKCRHCKRPIVPTEYNSWGDSDNPRYQVCDLADDYGPNHEPRPVDLARIRYKEAQAATIKAIAAERAAISEYSELLAELEDYLAELEDYRRYPTDNDDDENYRPSGFG